MGWAKYAMEKLQRGEIAQIRPHGHSMSGKVNDGDFVTLEPCNSDDLEIGDVVLVRVRGQIYLHLIKAKSNGRFLIGNNRGGTNGWVNGKAIWLMFRLSENTIQWVDGLPNY